MTLIPLPLRRGFDFVLEPFVRSLITRQVTPNTITTVGTAVLIGSAVAYGFAQVRLGGGLLLLSGAIDMIDGKVARGGGRITRFGAFYDSTLDRIGEGALFMGITFYFLDAGITAPWLPWAVGITLVALASGLTVSYARARAEGLGLDCRVGIAQRAERILVLGVPSVLVGPGRDGLVLLVIVSLLALTALVTVVQRIVHVYRVTHALEGVPQHGPTTTRADAVGKGPRGG